MTAWAKLRLASLFIPILGLSLWMGKLVYDRRNGVTLEIPIKGYDPRDLISGHYLEFRIDFGDKDPCKNSKTPPTEDGSRLCLCLNGYDKNLGIVWSGICSSKPESCHPILAGRCQGGNFVTGKERFYISEGDSKVLAVVPPHSTVMMTVSDNGDPSLKELKPEGQPYGEWIKSKRKAP